MYEITALNDMLMSDLQQVASSLNIPKVDDLSKQDLITSLLQAQETAPADTKKRKPRTTKISTGEKLTQPRKTKATKEVVEVTETPEAEPQEEEQQNIEPLAKATGNEEATGNDNVEDKQP